MLVYDRPIAQAEPGAAQTPPGMLASFDVLQLVRLLWQRKVAIVSVVGNEDGAHKISADLYQCLNDVGFTIPAGGVTYWNGEAMQGKDYKDLDETPKATAGTTKTLAANAAHLARLLKAEQYPPS